MKYIDTSIARFPYAFLFFLATNMVFCVIDKFTIFIIFVTITRVTGGQYGFCRIHASPDCRSLPHFPCVLHGRRLGSLSALASAGSGAWQYSPFHQLHEPAFQHFGYPRRNPSFPAGRAHALASCPAPLRRYPAGTLSGSLPAHGPLRSLPQLSCSLRVFPCCGEGKRVLQNSKEVSQSSDLSPVRASVLSLPSRARSTHALFRDLFA